MGENIILKDGKDTLLISKKLANKMAYYGTTIGKYQATYGDWSYNYIKHKQPKEYYENYKFEIEIRNTQTGEIEIEEIPILNNFISIHLLRKNYDWEYLDNDFLFNWLFKKIIEKEKLYCIPCIHTYMNDDSEHWGYFVLKSKIGEMPIRLESGKDRVLKNTNCKDGWNYYKFFGCLGFNPVVEITTSEQIKWLLNNGLSIKWTDEKGNMIL